MLGFRFFFNNIIGKDRLFRRWYLNQPVGVGVKDVAIGAGGRGFDSRAGQIGHCVTNGSPPLQRFCVAQELSRGDELAIWRYSANMMRI